MSQQTLHRSSSSHGLIDPFGRRIEYVRLSVTDRCNLRCFYCLPRGSSGFESPDDWLSFDEIERVMRAFAALGVSRIRLTGGEPLVRRELPVLAARLKAIDGIEDLSLSTNAVLLSDHVTNFLDVNGRLPDDRQLMLDTIDEALEWPETRFRPPTERLIRLGL